MLGALAVVCAQVISMLALHDALWTEPLLVGRRLGGMPKNMLWMMLGTLVGGGLVIALCCSASAQIFAYFRGRGRKSPDQRHLAFNFAGTICVLAVWCWLMSLTEGLLVVLIPGIWLWMNLLGLICMVLPKKYEGEDEEFDKIFVAG